MLRIMIFLLLMAPIGAFAQTHDMRSIGDHRAMMSHSPSAGAPTRAGQSAFAAIQEIVELLEADPKTDWSKVDIEALRRHLIDMDNVTLRTDVRNEPIEGGVRFVVTGAGPVRDSIQRMTAAHAATMHGVGGWTYANEATPCIVAA